MKRTCSCCSSPSDCVSISSSDDESKLLICKSASSFLSFDVARVKYSNFCCDEPAKNTPISV